MYVRPRTVDDALSLLQQPGWALLAGGTDFYPALGDQPVTRPVLDVSAIDALKGVVYANGHWRIGALATWSDLIRTELPTAFDALKQAAREVGSVQIQNRATIVGNLCNASPAADGAPPLMILDAVVELASVQSRRLLPLSEFLQGNRKTARRADEFVTAVLVPDRSAKGQSHFIKLGSRRYLVISIVMVAVRLEQDAAGTIIDAAVSVGACSPVARRLEALEKALCGQRVGSDWSDVLAAAPLQEIQPIDDVRAPSAYRLDAARELVRRALMQCCQPTKYPAARPT